MRRRLDGGDQSSAGDLATKTAEFLGGDDDDFVASMHGDVLGPLVPDAADELTEARFRVLQLPMCRLRCARAASDLRRPTPGRGFRSSSHADQNSISLRKVANLSGRLR